MAKAWARALLGVVLAAASASAASSEDARALLDDLGSGSPSPPTARFNGWRSPDALEQVTRIDFHDVVRNGAIDPASFDFQDPAGVNVFVDD